MSGPKENGSRWKDTLVHRQSRKPRIIQGTLTATCLPLGMGILMDARRVGKTWRLEAVERLTLLRGLHGLPRQKHR